MKVLLLKDYKNIGKKNDVVEVNDGYARNFLIPQRIATQATKSILNEHQHRIEKEEREQQERHQQALELKEILSTKKIDIPVKCGDGKMYGRVTSIDIAKALLDEGIEVDKRKIIISEPIKDLGEYTVEVRETADTRARLKINVIKAD